MLANRASSIDYSGVQRDHDEPLVLQPDGPLRHRHEGGGLRDVVRSHARDAERAHGLRLGVAGFEHDDLLSGACSEEREEGGDAVYHAQRVRLELKEM